MRRIIRKETKNNELRVERRTLNKEETLILNRTLCLGCGFCVDLCPKEALTVSPASLAKGRLIEKGEVDLDKERCVFCGICVVLCPATALRLIGEGGEPISLPEKGLFPIPMREIVIDDAHCDVRCRLKCQEDCPVEAMKVSVKSIPDEGEQITGVEVDKNLCLYCKRCEAACPLSLIQVQKPLSGTINIKTELCSEGCKICVNICPTHAIEFDDEGRLLTFPEFCIFCTACKRVCPEEAIELEINTLNYSGEDSGVWFTILERLTSKRVLARELAKESGKKRSTLVKERLS